MWPYICQFVEKLLHETIEPAVKESNSHLSTFSFSKIDLGDKVSTSQCSCLVSWPIMRCFSTDKTDYWRQVPFGTAGEGVWEHEREHTCTSLTYVLVSKIVSMWGQERGRPCAKHVGVWDGCNKCWCCADGLLCCGVAPEGQRGQGLYRKCG